MIDYHIHTNHSIDAQGSLVEYVEKAISLGMKEICFTNHCELDGERDDNLIRFDGHIQPLNRDALMNLQGEICALKELHQKDGIKIKFGIEVGFFEGIENRLKSVIEGLKLDYVLAGIHCLEHVCIDSSKECNEYFQSHNARELLKGYYDTMEQLIRSQLFDAVAHFDVYKKYGLSFYGDSIRVFDRDRVYHLFKLMVQHRIGLEINTAGLRRNGEFYPSKDLLGLAKDAGMEIITMGSDCHKPEDLAKGIKEAIGYARMFGFKRIYRFDNRVRLPLDI